MNSLVVESKPGARCPSVTCYLCGREFGTTSIAIHEKNCIEKWERAQSVLPKDQRRPRPQKPVPIQPSSNGSSNSSPNIKDLDAYNAAARDAYLDTARVECQNCSRKFAQDRLEIHLRSCKPGGFFARKMEQRAQTANTTDSPPKPEPNIPPIPKPARLPQQAKPIEKTPPIDTTCTISQPLKSKSIRGSPSNSMRSLSMVPSIAKSTSSSPTKKDSLKQSSISITGTIAKTSSRPPTAGSAAAIAAASVAKRNSVSMNSSETTLKSANLDTSDIKKESPKFCVECGVRQEGEWKFCSQCGRKK